MHQHYADILSRISAEPLWFDEEAVPRFDPFKPGDQANIYVDAVALVEVRCQGCGRVFMVCFVSSLLDHWDMAEAIREREIHFGDPPNMQCCASGPTMNSEPHRVVEYWSRNHAEFTKPMGAAPGLREVTDVRAYMEWRRDPALEIGIRPDWVTES